VAALNYSTVSLYGICEDYHQSPAKRCVKYDDCFGFLTKMPAVTEMVLNVQKSNRIFFIFCILLAFIGIFHVDALHAYYLESNSANQYDVTHVVHRSDDGEQGFSVLNNDWDERRQDDARTLTPRSKIVNAVDNIKLDLDFTTTYNYYRSFVSMEFSIADAIYANIQLRKMIEEYQRLLEMQEQFRSQAASISWFDYGLNSDTIDIHRKSVSYQQDKLSDQYSKTARQFGSHSPFFRSYTDIPDPDRIASFAQTSESSNPLKLSSQTIDASNLQAPARMEGTKQSGNLSSKNDKDGSLDQEKYDSSARQNGIGPWIIAVMVNVYKYMMKNKVEAAVYCVFLAFVVSFLSASRNKNR
jgi:hypothetical protein